MSIHQSCLILKLKRLCLILHWYFFLPRLCLTFSQTNILQLCSHPILFVWRHISAFCSRNQFDIKGTEYRRENSTTTHLHAFARAKIKTNNVKNALSYHYYVNSIYITTEWSYAVAIYISKLLNSTRIIDHVFIIRLKLWI